MSGWSTLFYRRRPIGSVFSPRRPAAFPRLRGGLFALLLASTGGAQPYVPGQTYFGGNQYIEYRAGNLPVVVTAPHGGSLTPASIPDRVPIPGQDVSTVGDANVIDVVRRIADVIFERTGRHVHLIVCHLARSKLDANRELLVAAQGNAAAGAAWSEYHGFISAACQSAQTGHGFSFLVDQHGHGHATPRLELGYNLGNTTLALNDTELARPRYQWDTYLRTLPLFEAGALPALLRGPRSLGEFLAARSFPACPSPRDPAPNDSSFFSGGYTTDTHTGRFDNGPGQGVQIEANYAGVRDTAANRQLFAVAVAEALQQFLFDRFGFNLGTGPIFRVLPPENELRAGGSTVNATIVREGYRSAAETIAVSYAGTAVRNTDYTAPSSVSFAAGQSTASLTLTPTVSIGTGGGDKTVEITLAPTSLQSAAPGPLIVPLGDGRSTIVRVEAAAARVGEGAGPAIFRLIRTDAGPPLAVNLNWSGTASAGRDYTFAAETANQASFAAGQRELMLSLPLLDDSVLRPARRVSLEIRPGSGYVVGAAASASIEITDNDTIPGLALWLPGTTRPGGSRDESGAGHHAAAQPGGTSLGVVSAPGGTGISFNGSEQTLQLPRFPLDPNRAFSLAFHFRLTPGVSFSSQNLVSFGSRGAPGTFHVYLSSATTLRTNLEDATGLLSDSELDVTGSWSDGTWHHYALVVDSQGGRRVYLDGLLVRSAGGWSGTLAPNEQLWLGWRPQNAAGGHLNGALADIRLYQRALTAAEVGTLAAASGESGGGASRLANLSIRTHAGTGDATLIVGFFAGGTGTSGSLSLLVRGVGPTLAAFGVAGALADPEIELVRNGSRVAANDDWGGGANLTAAFAAAGAFAFSSAGSHDAALLLPSLAPGAYSLLVRGAGSSTGIALAEIYDPAANSANVTTPRLTNLSARAEVGTGEDILIAGFVIAGNDARRVLLRAVGPTLNAFGVARPLANPQLAVFRNGSLVARNDDWGDDAILRAAFASVGAFALPAASADAALLLTLNPGAYSAQVSGSGGGTGVALVEVYEMP